MRNFLFMVAIVLILSTCGTTNKAVDNSGERNIKQELLGIWEFVILKDNQGVKVDTIRHSFGNEIPKGPLITFNKDGTYSKQFTPTNIDSGRWYFNGKENTIIYLLYYDKPYDTVSQYQINKGNATKDKNGDYYEVITDKVYALSDIELTIIEREGRRRTFKKR